MSMQMDFVVPRQIEDVVSVRLAIKSFEKNMTRMMVLMKELGNVLEGVSHSFDALTTLSFSNQSVRQYVHHFSEEIIRMKEGAPFQNYNRCVHEEVLAPVKALKVTLKEAEVAADQRQAAFSKYDKAKRQVDATEKSYAQKSRSLALSKGYPAQQVKRDKSLQTFREKDGVFQSTFSKLVGNVETVTAGTMKRYLDLNASYMASVIDALTKTDPTVEEAVAVCRQQLHVEKCSQIAARAHNVNVSNQNSNNSFETSNLSSSTPRRTSGMNNNNNNNNNNNDKVMSPIGNSVDSSVMPLSALSGSRQQLPISSPLPAVKGPPAAVRHQDPQLSAGSINPSPAAAAAASAAAHPGAIPDSSRASSAEHHGPSRPGPLTEDELEDFGSVSQVGGDGRPMPQYNFGRGPYSVAPSSVGPRSGYVAAQNNGLNEAFMKQMNGH